jgi:hypothetical protein
MSSNKSLLGTLVPQQNYKIEKPKVPCKTSCEILHQNEDSIMETIDSGFGTCNILVKQCSKPRLLSVLYKENYFSEFESDIEKQIVRNNLNVYSKNETDEALARLISKNSLVSKSEV